MVWEVKHLRFSPVGADGLPGEPLHLIVARDVLNPEALKFFASDAPAGTSIQEMLLVEFSRRHVRTSLGGGLSMRHPPGRLRRLGGRRRQLTSEVGPGGFFFGRRETFGRSRGDVRLPDRAGQDAPWKS